MISKHSSRECFVYITLPGETQSVTSGKLMLKKDRYGNMYFPIVIDMSLRFKSTPSCDPNRQVFTIQIGMPAKKKLA